MGRLIFQFQFVHGNIQFAHGNFNLPKAILITAISPNREPVHRLQFYLRRFQFTHGQFRNFAQDNFNFFYGNAHGFFRFSHLSATAADSGHTTKVKTQNQKSIYELPELGGIYMRLGRTQTSMSSYRSPYIFHAFTSLKMSSDRSDFISVKKQKTNLRLGP